MAGIGAEAVVPLQTNAGGLLAQAVAPRDNVVTPNSVAALADAFRKGQISADDIIERYGNLAKTKEKAQIQGLDEFIHPDAIAARQAQTALIGDRAKEEAASLPLEFQAKNAQYQATKIAAQQGNNKAMMDIAIKHGFGGYLPAPGTEFSEADARQVQKVYQIASRYENAIKGAQDIEKDVDRERYEVTDADGTITRDPSKDALHSKTSAITYTAEQAVRAKRLSNMTPEQYVAAGSPTVDDYVFGGSTAEGGGGGMGKNSVVPVKDLQTPKKTVTTKTTSPDGTVTEKTEVIEATSHPNPDAAAVIDKPSLDVSGAYVKKAGTGVPQKAMTDVQGRAALGLPRFEESNKLMEGLKSAGYNPAGTWQSATAFLPGPARPENRQSFELAKNAFAQGILRLESGAAISVSENKNYGEVFFPKWGDTPAVMQEKENLRAGVAAIAAEIATSGGVATPDVQAKANVIKERAKAVTSASPAAGGGTAHFLPEAKKTLVRTPDGRYIYQQ